MDVLRLHRENAVDKNEKGNEKNIEPLIPLVLFRPTPVA